MRITANKDTDRPEELLPVRTDLKTVLREILTGKACRMYHNSFRKYRRLMVLYAGFLLLPGLNNLCSAQCIDMKTDTVKLYTILCESSVSPETQYQLEVFSAGNSFYHASNFPFEALVCDSLNLECDKALVMSNYRSVVPAETIIATLKLKMQHSGKLLRQYDPDDSALARLFSCLKQDVIFDRFFIAETCFTAHYFVVTCRPQKGTLPEEVCDSLIRYNETLVISRINEVLQSPMD